MQIGNILQSFGDKKFRYGGYAALITAIGLALVIVFNLLVEQIPVSLDMTQNRRFSLSEQTYQAMDTLTEDVTIYHLAQTGRENPVVDEILKRYATHSKRVILDYIDPIRNPTRVKQFEKDGESLTEGSLIVSSKDRFKIISPYDLINYGYDQEYNPQAQSLAVEQRITSALNFVVGGAASTIYQLTGHRESPVPYDTFKQLELENFALEDVDLIAVESIPVESSILLVHSPKTDITKGEEEKIFAYLDAGGKALIMVDVAAIERPNLQRLLESYGVRLINAPIVEGDLSMAVASVPWYLLPNLKSHDILYPLTIGDLQVMIPYGQGLETIEMRKRTIDIESLLTTSVRAYAKTDPESDPETRQESDISGPFDLAVAITDNPTEERPTATRLVVIGNAMFLNSQFLEMVPGNGNFFMNTLNWLQERKETITIRPKSLLVPSLRLTGRMSLILSGIVVIIIPLLVLGAGLAVWLRRRHL